MIFVSYCHADETWRKRFQTISKPLTRHDEIVFWSDKNLKAGHWEPQIDDAMKKAEAAVFLVSDEFLASDYIMQREVPFFIEGYEKREKMVFWMLLTPCLMEKHPEIRAFQAMTDGDLKPLIGMTEFEWKMTMNAGCKMIDDFIRNREVPIVDKSLNWSKQSHPWHGNLLTKPARRLTEVLLLAGNRWYRQDPIKKGGMGTTIYLGDQKSPPGSQYKMVAMTTEQPLKDRASFSELPPFRAKSEEINMVRA